MNDVFFKECNVLKTNQYDALKVWKYLEVSKQFYLSRENVDGKECVFLYYKVTEEDKRRDKDMDGEDKDKHYEVLLNKFFKIGNLSEEDATPIDKFLKARQILNVDVEKNNEFDVDDIFECLISKCDKKADEDKRFSVAIFIKKSSKKNIAVR